MSLRRVPRPAQLDELLYRPDHSIIHQSVDAEEREEPLNGDGWGVGWYDPDTSDLVSTVRDGLECLETLKHEVGKGEETTWANFCLTDGETAIEPLDLDVPAA